MIFQSFSDKLYSDSIEFGIKNGGAGYLSYKFVLLCKKDFKDWKSYSDGFITEDGDLLKEYEIPLFDNLVRKLKKILIGEYGNKINYLSTINEIFTVQTKNNYLTKVAIADILEEKEILLLEEIIQELKREN